MKIIGKSIRQMLRTPVRSALFLLLIALAAALLSLGAGLYRLSAENVRRLDDIFVTIGMVEQKPTAIQVKKVWDAEKKEYVSREPQAEYGSIVPVEALYFEGADYIYPPVRTPYYGACNPDWTTHQSEWEVSYTAQMRQSLPIYEFEPVEDSTPNVPALMKITKVFYGVKTELAGWETFWFCYHHNPDPQPLYAGRKYVMALSWELGHNYSAKARTYEHWPISINSTQSRPDGERIPDVFPMEAPWDEVTEGFYDTPRGQRWLALAEAMYISEYTIPVVPAFKTELLMSFYNGNSSIMDGRDITDAEYQTGARVCLISREFSESNGFSVGDKLTLPLYYADYRDSASRDFSPNDSILGIPEVLLNARGERYEIFEENEYTIVGVYNEINKPSRSTGYDMAMNAVVIPALSVENSDENNILNYGPMMGYNTAFQIPNGSIDKFMKEWEKQGIDDLEITFYDRGYTLFKDGLDKIKGIALALFIAGILITILILLFFCQLFIGKQKKRTAIERSLGMNKAKCTLSLLSGIFVIVLLGSAAGSAAGYYLTSNAMGRFVGQVQEKTFDTSFSSWSNASDAEIEVQFDTSSVEPLVCVLSGMFIVILSAGIAMAGIRSNLRSEPLKLLSMRET